MAPDSNASVESFVQHCKGQMIPVNQYLSYFSVIPLEDSELQRLVYDPAATLPPKMASLLPRLRLVIVGYLDQSDESDGEGQASVVFQPPSPARQAYSAVIESDGEDYIFLAIKDEDIADCHDTFYQELAELVARKGDSEIRKRFAELVEKELRDEVRGEIDDQGWTLKEKLLHGRKPIDRASEAFREYSEQALADSLALYLHGLCCDIDVEGGPRQLPSPAIRRRLTLIRELLPPPTGVAVFPEELPVTRG